MARPVLVVIHGAKALSAAVRAVFDHPVMARCQLHKIRNVVSKLPEALGSTVAKKIRAAYRMNSSLAAQAALESLARDLAKPHPGAAGALREGLAETHRHASPCTPHAGPPAAHHQLHRVHDRHLPGPLHQTETPARRPDGPALMRRRDGRSYQTVLERQGFLDPPPVRRAVEAEVAKITVTPPEYDQAVA